MIRTILVVVGTLVVLVATFVVWRFTSVARGARQRDEKLLVRIDPIARRIDAGEAVSPGEVAALAAHPEMRYLLFMALRRMDRAELLPTAYSSSVAQGEAALAYWMMHPNELQDPPELIEHVETVTRTVDGREADFHVYRYRMPATHWAGSHGWQLGVTGPMAADSEPYSSLPGAFSRAGDVEGKVSPPELVDWYVGMLRQKGMVR